MCRVLGVSRSGAYDWRQRDRSERDYEDGALIERIRAVHETSYGTYGVPRAHAELREAGVRVGRKRIARLMRSESLHGVNHRKGFKTPPPAVSATASRTWSTAISARPR
jgi:putative transposase